MRVVNVRNKCASISLRCFLSRNRKVVLSSFSHNSKPNDNPVQPEEEEDFFGITENRLRQIRLGTRGEQHIQEENQNREALTSGSETSRGDNRSLAEAYRRHSLHERHKVTHTTFNTTFGAITLDKAVLDKLPNACTEDVAFKAQEILNNLNIGSNKMTASSANRTAEKNKNRRSKESLNQTNTISQAPTQANQDSFKATSRHSRASTNYFDEVYFPEQSLEEDTNTPRRTSTLRSSHHIPDSVCGTTSRHHSEASRSSVSEVNGVSKSETSKYSSLHAEPYESESPKVHSANVVDEQYFGAVLTCNSGIVEHTQPGSSNTEDPLLLRDNYSETSVEVQHKNRSDVENKEMVKKAVDFNEIDLQYFGTTSQNLNVHESVNQQETVTVDERTNPSFHNIVEDYVNPLNLKQSIKISSQINEKGRKMYTKNVVGQKNPAAEMKLTDETSNKQEVQDRVHHPHLNMMNSEHSSAVVKDTEKYTRINQQKSAETPHQPELATDSNVITNEQFLNKWKTKTTKTETEAEKPETAYEVAMKIRHQLQQGIEAEETLNKVNSSSQTTEDTMLTDSNIKLDSKGFRVLDNQVTDLGKMTSADLVRMLKNRIIFNHDDFLAIDKPYGLPCVSQVNDRVSVTELLPSFAEHLPQSFNASELHLVQGLDRDVSGAIILAKNPEVAQILRGMYKDSELVTQKFWAVTKGVPKPPAGVIDIPIGEAKVGNVYKMVLRPRFMKEEKPIGRTSKASSERAITEYKVLSSFLHAALVECILLTNVKHQIRLHLASGLGTPILGDHKYSNFAKLAPQKLHKETLELLKIRQASVRQLAMHLHCRSIILKDYKGQMIFLTTYPPSHFRDNMRNLRVPKVQ